MNNFLFDAQRGLIELEDGSTLDLSDPRAFEIISDAWLRVGWDSKYVYSFSWQGRPIIQLPDDLMRIQEVIYDVRPDVIVETGVAHGGSLVFYATLFESWGSGKVIGVDIDIRPHNRRAIESHHLAPRIELIEGSSTDPLTFDAVRGKIDNGQTVMVILDSDHSYKHVLAELERYSSLVSVGSYIVVCDGIMRHLDGAPRSRPEWKWDNPLSALEAFLESTSGFSLVEPEFPFNEGSINQRVTYWPKAFLRRKY